MNTTPLQPEGRNLESEAALFPLLEPYSTGYLEESHGIHKIYYEQCGNPKGKPVVILHGGPGSGSGSKQRRFHDPDRYRIILFDQRGSGR